MVIDLLSWFFLLSGAFFMLAAGIGVLRLPDLFTRMHAAGMKDTLGTALTMIGLMLQAGFSLVSVKLVLIWAFIWFTSPVASHATARAALLSGVRPILTRRYHTAAVAGAAVPGAENADDDGARQDGTP